MGAAVSPYYLRTYETEHILWDVAQKHRERQYKPTLLKRSVRAYRFFVKMYLIFSTPRSHRGKHRPRAWLGKKDPQDEPPTNQD